MTVDDLTMTITGLELGEKWTRLYVRIENSTDHSIDCGYVASLIADGRQYDTGLGDFDGGIASAAALDSFFQWKAVVSPDVQLVRLIAKCWDDTLGNYGGKALNFDVEATR